MPQENRLTHGKGWHAYLLPLLVLTMIQPGIGAQPEMPQLPTEPILRIEAGQHTGLTYGYATDAANKFAVTGSDDKSVRVWSLPDGRLLRVLRLPIGYSIGKVYTVAVSPDGSTIAVGGYTTTKPPENIFLFDRASGAMKQRLSSDLPSVIFHLAYSADGRRLAASLGHKGIRVFDASDGYRLLPSDTNYEGMARWLTFDRTGRLATASYDGVVRLYEADKYTTPIARFERKGSKPFSVAFSPDGTRVAVSDYDSPSVSVLSASNLTELFKADTAGVPKNYSLNSVEWSQDGSFLYAGGSWTVNLVRQVRRWSNGGRGPFIDIPASSQAIITLIRLKSDSILIGGTEDFGLIDVDAKVTKLQGFGSLALQSGGGHRLLISNDSSIVQIDAWHPRHAYRFAIADRLVNIDPSRDHTLASPIEKGSGLDITNWLSSTTPAVNGTPIKLNENEQARSIAVVPGTQRFVLGADYTLRLLDQLGHQVWSLLAPSVAWHVNITDDQRLVVVAYGDGTIRWHRLSDVLGLVGSG